MKTRLALAALAAGTLFNAQHAHAAADLQITEVYTGISGDDGTPDWFEITNVGDMAGSTAGLFYDDESADPTVDDALPTVVLAPGQGAVFLLSNNPADDANFTTAIDEFKAIWGADSNVFALLSPGAGLASDGDGVFIFDGNTAGASVVDSVTYGSTFNNSLTTIDFDAAGTGSLSALGVNGAYQSAGFFNDNPTIGAPNNTVSLIGSPAQIPEPASLGLLAAGGILLAGRRRRPA